MEQPSSPTNADQLAEADRIRSAYLRRDASGAPSPYHFLNPGYCFYMQLLEAGVLRALRTAPVDLRSAHVLEVGCGSGYFVHRMSEYGAASVVGIDLMPERIDAARRRYPGLTFETANATELPFGDAEFDLVTQFTCFSSVLDPGMRAAIGGEIWRVLKPGGAVLSYDLRPGSIAIRGLRWLGRRRRGEDEMPMPTPTLGIPRDELARMFPQAELSYESVGLAFGLCGIAERSQLAALLLAGIPGLREHAIGLLAKPAH